MAKLTNTLKFGSLVTTFQLIHNDSLFYLQDWLKVEETILPEEKLVLAKLGKKLSLRTVTN